MDSPTDPPTAVDSLPAPAPAPAAAPAPAPITTPSPDVAAPRGDLVQSAVRFLTDPKVQGSSLEKRRAFLSNKGLTQAEIDTAMAQAGLSGANSSSSSGTAYGGYLQPVAYSHAPPAHPPPPVPPRMHWKDYFIAAVVASGAGFGLYSITTKYFIPYLRRAAFADFQERLDKERNEVDAHLSQTRDTLTLLQQQTTESTRVVNDQSAQLQKAVDTMTRVLEQWQERETQRSRDMDSIKTDFEAITKLLPDAVDKSKDTQSAAFQNLQTEIKGLKTMLLTRRSASSTPVVVNAPSPSAVGSTDGTFSPAAYPMPTPGGNDGSSSTNVAASEPYYNGAANSYKPAGSYPAAGPSSSSYAAKAAAFTNRGASTGNGGIPAWQMAQSQAKVNAPNPDKQPASESGSANPDTNDESSPSIHNEN
ncbi:peroxisomal membrane anchor protein conserved region-domain-containing protein [Dimargaris cristalligena]|uniref:Peroxisomal membrane protein PEX14 n=1 Tax=Dimargaris cristalligena TaxID=215637 RepID=A0A4P9ZVX7_9FUNG|nr:peroxisomal membrane anchor protein conserved region-domain-containing protein [Dimargaris cristalligena]|eukprot:RKP37438.1 peroxisomal membrane anchor protein conserved region-domain-containing protein [Dimargaris cristalligena]